MKKFEKFFPVLAAACVLCFALTGCGNSDNSSTSGNNDNNAVENAADDVGNAVEDVADGVGNAVNDLVGNGGFNNYNDAHDYFMNTMTSYHSDANFELRDEDQNLNDYQEGSKGYHFKLYDTSSNENGEFFGEFYVDATSGRIYKKGEDGTITEYPVTGNGTNTGNGMNNGNGTNTGNDTNTGNGTTTGNNTNTGNGTNNGNNGTATGNTTTTNK